MIAETEDFGHGDFSSRGPQDIRPEESTLHSCAAIMELCCSVRTPTRQYGKRLHVIEQAQ